MFHPDQRFPWTPAIGLPRQSPLKRQARLLQVVKPGPIFREENAADPENVRLMTALKLNVLKEFKCHKYSYMFTPKVPSYLVAKFLSKVSSAVIHDAEHLYLPSKDNKIRSVWFSKTEYPLDVQKLMKENILLETEYIGTETNRQLVLRLLLQKTSDLIQQHYLGTAQGSNFCEEVFLTTFPGHVVGIKDFNDDEQKSIAVFCYITKDNIFVRNIYQRLQLLEHCSNFTAMFNTNLLRRQIISAHTGKEYIIEAVGENTTASSPMNKICEDPKEETFKNFYKENYALEASDDSQKIIYIKKNVDSVNLVKVLPEFCEMVPEDNPFVVNEKVCHQNFIKFINTCCNDNSLIAKLFAHWGFKFTKQYSFTNMQNFFAESVIKNFQREQSKSKYINPELFSECFKEIYRQPFARTIADGFQSWAIIAPPKNRTNFILWRFKNAVRKLARETNIKISSPSIEYVTEYDDEIQTIQDYLSKLEKAYYNESPLHFAVVILPWQDYKNQIYEMLKSFATKLKFVTQMVQLRTLDCSPSKLDDIVANMFSQINCKLGGIPWAIETPFKGVVTIGIHAIPGCIAFSATIDDNCESWLFEARLIEQETHILLHESLKLADFMSHVLKEYCEKHGHFPEQILVVRNFEDIAHKTLIQDSINSNINFLNLYIAKFVPTSGGIPPQLLYCEMSDHCNWDHYETVDNQVTLMTPFHTPRSIFPAVIRLCNEDDFPLTSGPVNGRIRSMADIQLALILNSFLYYNAARFAPQPAILINARKLAFYCKNVIKRGVNPTEQMEFL